MTILPETEIVASRYDPRTQTCTYTAERGGKRWTVTIPAAEFAKHGKNKDGRRKHLATALIAKMQGSADDAGPAPAA